MKHSFFYRAAAVFLCLSCASAAAPAQTAGGSAGELITLDFRDQKISDILLTLADIGGQSVVTDSTVTGTASFHFSEADFDTALSRFADYARLYVEKKDGVYYVSKVKIDSTPAGITVDAESVPVNAFLEILSRKIQKTIMSDPFPQDASVTIRTQNASPEDVLRLVLTKYPDYELSDDNGGFYFARTASRGESARTGNSLSVVVKTNLFTISVKKATLNAVIDLLFKKAGKEYSLLNKTAVTLENLSYENMEFDRLLRIVLEQSNCDFTVDNGMYYIFEIQRRDIIKKLKTTVAVRLKNVNASDVMDFFPTELNASSFSRVDKNTNTIYVTGSSDEIKPVLDFLSSVDVPVEGRYYQNFTVYDIDVKDAVALIPKSMLYTDAILIPGTSSFVTQVTADSEKKLHDFLKLADRKNRSYPVRLRYIRSEDLIKYLPPSAEKDSITVTTDSSLVFFTGAEEKYEAFKRDLNLIDQPRQQIRYQLLVIQHQKTDGLNWSSSLSGSKTTDSSTSAFSATLSNLVNISFDIVSQFGFQFAAALNAELSNNTAHVLADTTLNGISGEAISFQNTNTYRYRDVAIDADSGLYTGTTREISSGLVLKISGWVSGDDMITVDVNAQVSKQGDSDDSSSSSSSTSTSSTTTNPPSTSEKSVTTNVRTKSGSPVIIGGLLQTETDSTIKRVPVLGAIPFLGNLFKTRTESKADTELVIYLVPFVETSGDRSIDYNKKIRMYYRKYISGGSE